MPCALIRACRASVCSQSSGEKCQARESASPATPDSGHQQSGIARNFIADEQARVVQRRRQTSPPDQVAQVGLNGGPDSLRDLGQRPAEQGQSPGPARRPVPRPGAGSSTCAAARPRRPPRARRPGRSGAGLRRPPRGARRRTGPRPRRRSPAGNRPGAVQPGESDIDTPIDQWHQDIHRLGLRSAQPAAPAGPPTGRADAAPPAPVSTLRGPAYSSAAISRCSSAAGRCESDRRRGAAPATARRRGCGNPQRARSCRIRVPANGRSRRAAWPLTRRGAAGRTVRFLAWEQGHIGGLTLEQARAGAPLPRLGTNLQETFSIVAYNRVTHPGQGKLPEVRATLGLADVYMGERRYEAE